MEVVARAQILGYEKRRDGGKHYVYVIKVTYASSKKEVVYRRYSQFDAFRATVENLVRELNVDLPRLPPKKYLGRSSIHGVAIQRRPILQRFLNTTLAVKGMDTVQQVLAFFLTPTTADLADSKMAGRRTMEGHLSDDDSDLDDQEDLGIENEPKAKAKTIDEEIRLTEKEFYQHLVEVKDSFFPQLRSILTAPEAKCLFGNWAELVTLSNGLNISLAANVKSTASTLATQLPSLVEPYMKYCSGIPAAQELYQKKLTDKAFSKFESSFTTLNKPTLSNLMRPVQRVMKYPLLLMELKKFVQKTSGDENELREIETALNIASNLATAANSKMNEPLVSLNATQISRPQSGTFHHLSRGSEEVVVAQKRCLYRSERVCRHFVIDGSTFCEMHTCEMEDCFEKKSSRQVFCTRCTTALEDGTKLKSIRRKSAKSSGRNLYESWEVNVAAQKTPPSVPKQAKPMLVPMATSNSTKYPPPPPSLTKQTTITTTTMAMTTQSTTNVKPPPPPVPTTVKAPPPPPQASPNPPPLSRTDPPSHSPTHVTQTPLRSAPQLGNAVNTTPLTSPLSSLNLSANVSPSPQKPLAPPKPQFDTKVLLDKSEKSKPGSVQMKVAEKLEQQEQQEGQEGQHQDQDQDQDPGRTRLTSKACAGTVSAAKSLFEKS